MAILPDKPQFVDASSYYGAKELRQPYADFLTNGVVGPNDGLVVPKNGTAANPDAGGGTRDMSVDVLGGSGAAAWVYGTVTPSTQGIYRQQIATARENLSVPANATGSTRKDLVQLRIDESGQQGLLEYVTGTTSLPALSNDAIQLAEVDVPNGATSIVGSNVKDARGRAYRQSLSFVMTGADLRCDAGTSTTLLTTTFSLVRSRRILLGGKAAFYSASASGAVSLKLRIDGNVADAAGPIFINNSTDGNHQALAIPTDSYELASGSHTVELFARRDGTGSIFARGDSTTLSAGDSTFWPTKFVIVL